MKTHALLGCLLVAVAAGCKDPTEVMLIVKAGPGLTFGSGGDIDTVRVKVQPAADDPQLFTFTRSVDLCALNEQGSTDCRPEKYAAADYDRSLTLPLRLVFEPGSLGLDQQVRVWVDALSGSKVQISNGIRFRFSRDRRLWIEMPLYRDCIGLLTCQPLDLICGIDKNCTDAPTTDNQPIIDIIENNDLAGLVTAPDAAQACGALGLQCCGSRCDAPFSCNDNGYCIDPATTCGQEGQPCCTGVCTGALTCDNATQTCRTACGDTFKDCCGGGLCNKGSDKCIAGTCQPCGGSGQQCCPASGVGPYCNGQNYCNGATGQCEGCGAFGEQCCPNQICFQGTCQSGAGLDGGNSGDLSRPPDMAKADMTVSAPLDGFITLDGGSMMSAQPGATWSSEAAPGGMTCQ